MIRIQGQYELADFKQAVALAGRHRSLPPLLVAIGDWAMWLLVTAIFLGMVNFGNSVSGWLVLFVWLAQLIVWYSAARPWLLARAFSRSKILSTPFEIELTDLAFTLRNANGLESVKWSQVSRWHETQDLVVLNVLRGFSLADGMPAPPSRRLWNVFIFLYRLYTGRHFHILPKRFLQSENELAYVRERLHANRVSAIDGKIWLQETAFGAINFIAIGFIVLIIVGLIALAVRR